MVATWVTDSSTDVSVVEYGHTNLTLVAKGIEEKFVDGGSQKRALYMHRVKMTGLVPGSQYSKLIFYNLFVNIGNVYGKYAVKFTIYFNQVVTYLL